MVAKTRRVAKVEVEVEVPAVLEAMQILALQGAPEKHWCIGDDLCDCLFQRIYDTNNPHIGRTMRVRECCIWKAIYEQYPQFVQVLPYYDPNRYTYNPEPQPWDSTEMDMPVALWHRYLAVQQGKSVAEIREEYAGRERERPKRVKVSRAKQPTKAELKHAHEQQLRAATWLLPDESIDSILVLQERHREDIYHPVTHSV